MCWLNSFTVYEFDMEHITLYLLIFVLMEVGIICTIVSKYLL